MSNKLVGLVEARVASALPSALLTALTVQHQRHGHKSRCQCRYCRTKQHITTHRPYPGWRDAEARRAARDRLNAAANPQE